MAAFLKKVIGIGYRAARRGLIEFYKSNNLTFASSIAYYSLLSIFPFLLLVLSILSQVAVGSDLRMAHWIERALPSNFDFLITQMRALASASFNWSIAGTVLLLWGSMGVFGAITSAVNHAWGVEQDYGFFKHKLVAFLMLLTAGLLLVFALVLVSAAQVVEAQWFSDVVARFPWLSELSSFAYRNAPTPMFMLVVGLIYYFIPNADVRLRDVWFGAILAGLLWRGAFAGFAWYLSASRFSIHGSVGAVVAFLLWVYISAVILLYGVEVTAAYARERKHLPEGMPAAPARPA